MTNRKRITFETETCSRCGGSGEYPSAAWQGMCLGCNRTGRRMTRRGKAAKRRYDELIEAMSKPVTDVEVGDRVQFASSPKWYTVSSSKPYFPQEGAQMSGDWWELQTNGQGLIAQTTSLVKVWDAEVFDNALRVVGRMKGATVEGLEEEPEEASEEPHTGRVSHAGHDHPNTPAARAACRRALASA